MVSAILFALMGSALGANIPSVVIPAVPGVSTTTTTTQYSVPTIVPTEMSPFVARHKDINGTVFIAVGTIILSIMFILLLMRFVFWIKNRRVTKFDDMDDYYGNFYMYDDYEKNPSGIQLDTKYDSSKFNTSSNNSYYSKPSRSSSNRNISSASPSSSNDSSPRTENVSVSRPGRTLRPSPPAPAFQKRASFISPINAMMSESLLSLQGDSSTENFQSPADALAHRKSASISMLLSGSQLDVTKSPRSFSNAGFDDKGVKNKVEESLRKKRVESPNENSTAIFKKGHSRPPSMILDDLLNI